MRKVLSVLVASSFAAAASPAQADPGPYVALGDSYTSAPLVLPLTGTPLGCLRSTSGYPALVTRALGISAFTDASCSSANTQAMTTSQPVTLGTNPPQFDGLRSDTRIVTIGIGANDIDLIGIALTCINRGLLAPTGTACRSNYARPDGSDANVAKIAATGPKIAAVLNGAGARAPQARILLVGYPDVMPPAGSSCYPLVPMSPDDMRYFDGLIVALNAMLAAQAAANGAEFADTYADSVGHDVCAPPLTRWFEGLLPTNVALPLHPNALGMQSVARSVLRVLGSPQPPLTRLCGRASVRATGGAWVTRPTPSSATRPRSACRRAGSTSHRRYGGWSRRTDSRRTLR